MKDPLIHLVRNCIDHGIEKPELRQQLGKNRQGSLGILVSKPSERTISVVVQDDGAGISLERVRRSAIHEGLITEEAATELSQEEVLRFVFRSGVSTSTLITDLSGRGLGMAIVAEKIEKLGGQIAIQSEEGKGTTFTIQLPLTLATFRGVLIQLGENRLMIPLGNVERVSRLDKVTIKSIENRQIVEHDNHQLPLAELTNILGLPNARGSGNRHRYILVLSSGNQKAAFMVDAVIGEQEGILKPLGGQLLKVRHVSGATTLGDGRVVPVLDATELLESVTRHTTLRTAASTEVSETEPERPKKILLAEDSLTSRALLRNLLENAGYEVVSAVDGWEGFTLLKQDRFDLVVTDVEMPRMNGFELTAKIRSESELFSLPVILVTALETPEDRQRGIESGANAYIGKSTFEGGNLLETIQRLI